MCGGGHSWDGASVGEAGQRVWSPSREFINRLDKTKRRRRNQGEGTKGADSPAPEGSFLQAACHAWTLFPCPRDRPALAAAGGTELEPTPFPRTTLPLTLPRPTVTMQGCR